MKNYTSFICTTCDSVHRYKPASGCKNNYCDGDRFKVPLADAKLAATKVEDLLGAVCKRIAIAGSIRRGRQFVKDIEIVAEPLLLPPEGQLFDVPDEEKVSALDRHVRGLVARPSSGLTFDEKCKRNGSKYKRLVWQNGLTVDLFIVLPPASWGAILAIRTGPADFSSLLVSDRPHGAMPGCLSQQQGALHTTSGPLDTPEESDYFAALGVPTWPPAERTAGKLKSYLKGGTPSACTVEAAR